MADRDICETSQVVPPPSPIPPLPLRCGAGEPFRLTAKTSTAMLPILY